MVIATHAIISAYGFWLPNDPRGSWSEFVGAWELFRSGRATKVTTRRSLAGRPHNNTARLEAKKSLKYPAVCFTGVQARAVARGFGAYLKRSGVCMHACSIMPDHAHLVIARHSTPVQQIAIQLKGASTRQLNAEGIHPLDGFVTKAGRTPNAWSRGEWKVFLNEPKDVHRAIRYVENNPMRDRLPPQRWRFVTPYDG